MKLLLVVALINLGPYLGLSFSPLTKSGISTQSEVAVQPEKPAAASSASTILAVAKVPAARPAARVAVREESSDPEVWSQTYSSPDVDSDQIALDAEGDLLMAGSAFVVGENLDVRVSKYDRDGAVVWTKTFADTPAGSDDAYTVAIDDQGHVLGTGYEEEDYW